MLEFTSMNPTTSNNAPPLPIERLLTARQVAAVLGVSRQRVDRLAREGEVSFVLVGARRRFRPSELQRYIDANTNGEEVA